jgi:hypothetical protein
MDLSNPQEMDLQLCKRNKPHMHSRYLDRKGDESSQFLPKLEQRRGSTKNGFGRYNVLSPGRLPASTLVRTNKSSASPFKAM